MFLVEEVQKLDRSARWNYTFQVLNLETRKVVEDFTLKAARLPEHRNLNRYRDVLPYDHSRVTLQEGNTNYINGNIVEVEGVGRKYILTQGPLPDTCSHFWQMVWEQNSGAVVMLNKVIEKNAVKCHPYWPMGEDEVHEYGDYSIRNLAERAEDAYVVRDLVLQHVPSGKSREIKQFHYMLWPDFGVPSRPETFLQFLYDIRETGVFEEGQGPAVIHCSAGIGRSGTFCLVDSVLLKAEIDGKADDIDVKEMLLQLRRYRVGLVQTPEQLRFSYLAIIQGIANLYPELFKIKKNDNEESHKRKAVDEVENDELGGHEPPPVPPRKRAPPEKPPRRLENAATTAAEESLKQKKMVENLKGGLVDESSDEGGSDEEVLDLSASEDEKELVEVYSSDEELGEDTEAKDSQPPSFPEQDIPRKPLPPLPKAKDDEGELLGKKKEESLESSHSQSIGDAEDSGQESSHPPFNVTVEDGGKSLPRFSADDEEEGVSENDLSSRLEADKSETTVGRCQNQESSSDTSVIKRREVAEKEVAGRNMQVGQENGEDIQKDSSKEADKAREERELRQRKRRDEKNQQTAEVIQKIKRTMQEKELAAASYVMHKKSLIAIGISAALLGYYWLFG